MGLFSKKDPCAICGGKVKGLFSNKIDGHYICSDCYGVVDLPAETLGRMRVEDFRGYMTFREENDQLRKAFQTTSQVDFGWLDNKFLFDEQNRLLCMNKHLTTTIFRGQEIRSFAIYEDAALLIEGSEAGIFYHPSMVPASARAMEPDITRFRMHAELQRTAQRILDRDDNNNRPAPRFDMPEPFQNFNVEIRFDHPYWHVFTADMSGPRFDNERPDVNDYLNEYHRNVETMQQLAQALAAVAFPHAAHKKAQEAQNAAAAPAVDAVEELRRYKALVEQGILTEEEFTAKKRQLLGL